MDANGIGTDATMAEHIAKVQEREYVITQSASTSTNSSDSTSTIARGGRGVALGSARGGRGGSTTSRATTRSVEHFIPTTLGIALIEGYDSMLGLETSLGKPFLRKEMEQKMREVCAGTKSRSAFVQETLEQYRGVYARSVSQVGMLKTVSDTFLSSLV